MVVRGFPAVLEAILHDLLTGVLLLVHHVVLGYGGSLGLHLADKLLLLRLLHALLLLRDHHLDLLLLVLLGWLRLDLWLALIEQHDHFGRRVCFSWVLACHLLRGALRVVQLLLRVEVVAGLARLLLGGLAARGGGLLSVVERHLLVCLERVLLRHGEMGVLQLLLGGRLLHLRGLRVVFAKHGLLRLLLLLLLLHGEEHLLLLVEVRLVGNPRGHGLGQGVHAAMARVLEHVDLVARWGPLAEVKALVARGELISWRVVFVLLYLVKFVLHDLNRLVAILQLLPVVVVLDAVLGGVHAGGLPLVLVAGVAVELGGGKCVVGRELLETSLRLRS